MVYSILAACIIFFFGASIGSFIAASVYRMENKKPIFYGRSECVSCGKKLRFFDLVPVFSYLFLRGKCRRCRKPIGFADFLTEIVCGALFLAAFLFHSVPAVPVDKFVLLMLRDWIFLGGLLFLSLYDFRYGFIPDSVSIPLIIAVFALNLSLGWNIFNLLLAMAAGGGFFLAQYLISRGKWIGDGDIRLGALLGAGLGWPGVAVAVFLAYILGSISGIILLLEKKKTLKSEMAFGTFLAVGGAIALFWGGAIVKWYLNL